MRRFATGGLMALAMFVYAARAESQVTVEPRNPVSVYYNSTQSTYQADVTCGSTFKFYLKVYHNETVNPNPKHSSTTWITNPPPVYSFQKVVSHVGWGMVTGDLLRYNGKAQKVSTGETGEADWFVTVSDPGTYRTPDRDRKEWEREELWA
jgi:hypothetical protein